MKEALRNIAPGTISFYIKATDNNKNVDVHEGFKSFARDECAGDYTRALETLLTYYQDEAKFELVWEYIKTLKLELDELRIQVQNKEVQATDKEEGPGTF